MPAAAADAPTGSHHVFARKKYVLMSVISQMTTRRTRPMCPDLPVECSAVVIDPARQPSDSGFPWPENGASLPQVIARASGFLHVFIFERDGAARVGRTSLRRK